MSDRLYVYIFYFILQFLIYIYLLFVVKNKLHYAYTQEFPYRTNHILECEFYLLENLDCCLIVFQPYRPLLQLVQDIGPHEDQLLALAWRVVNDSLRTDLSLLYPPYQIAIGKYYYIQYYTPAQERTVGEIRLSQRIS